MTYKNAKTILFASLLVAMILPFSTMELASADNEVNEPKKIKHGSITEVTTIGDRQTSDGLIPIPMDEEREKYQKLIKENPMPTDNVKSNQAQKHATNDGRVMNLLGDGFKHSSTAFYLDGEKWQPIVNFKTKDGKHTITVTMDDDKVKKIQKSKTVKYTDQAAGFGIRAIDQPYTMSGNLMALNAPDYTHNGDVVGQPNWVVLLLNSMKAGSTGDVCESADMPNTYWQQVGLEFSSDGIRAVFTDTGLNCDAQSFEMPVNANDRMDIFTVIDDATDTWTSYVINYDIPSGEPNMYGYYRVVTDSDLMDTTSITGTNVFFENQNTASTAWSLGFADDVTVDYAGFIYPPTENWYYWQGDKFASAGCHPGPIVEEVDLLIGSFTSATHDVTWDVSEMDTLCGQN